MLSRSSDADSERRPGGNSSGLALSRCDAKNFFFLANSGNKVAPFRVRTGRWPGFVVAAVGGAKACR